MQRRKEKKNKISKDRRNGNVQWTFEYFESIDEFRSPITYYQLTENISLRKYQSSLNKTDIIQLKLPFFKPIHSVSIKFFLFDFNFSVFIILLTS